MQPIYDGYTPNQQKICVRCKQPNDCVLYDLCANCRQGDALAEKFCDDEGLMKAAFHIREEMNVFPRLENAEYFLNLYIDSLNRAEEYKVNPPTKKGPWVEEMQINAEHYMKEARMCLA